MRVIALLSLLSFWSFVILGFYIYLQNAKDPVNKSYFLFSVVLMFVSFGELMMQSAFSPVGVDIWIQVHLIAGMFIGPYYLYFSLVFSRLVDIKKIRQAYFIIPSFLVGLIFTNIGISGDIIKQPWGYTYEIGNLPIFELCAFYSWFSGVIGSALVLYVYFTSRKSNQKKQALIIFAGIWVPIIGTLFTVFIFPIFGFQFPILVSFPFLFQFVLMSYAIWRYSLFVDPVKAARNIVGVMSESLLTADLSGIISSVNTPMCELLNYDETDLISASTDRIFSRKSEFADLLDRLKHGERTIKNVETELLTGKNKRVPVLLSLSILPDRREEAVGFLVLARDITEIRAAQRALSKARDELETKVKERTADLKASNEALAAQTEELARSNAELEQFAYVASHDLQEPLRMISSYIELLSRRYKGRLDEDADDFINFAVEGAMRMKALIDDLLTYSRVSTRGRAFEPVDCNAVLEKVLFNLKAAVEESGGEVTHDPLPTINGDPSQMMQLFQNLVANAIKFRRENVAPEVHILAEEQPDEWIFSVQDNDIGIEPAYIDRIFLVFQRLQPREKYAGTGIGLALCKRIVERHNGRIWVESEPGVGSIFYFSIPK